MLMLWWQVAAATAELLYLYYENFGANKIGLLID